MASRDIKELVPELQEKFYKFQKAMEDAGLRFIITCTSRSILEQVALFAQGRMDIRDINKLRSMAKMGVLRNKNHKVTWTLHSKHLTNLYDADLNNDFSEAFDIALLKGRRASWDIKADVNQNEIPDYEEAGRIGEALGLTWGGRWRKPDYVHFQLFSH